MSRIEITQIITGCLGSSAFAILFNIKGRKFLAAAFGGFLSWTLFVVFGLVIASEPIRYFIVAVLISVYAEIMARGLKTPTTTFHMTSLIPLIPGGSLYYTMASVFEGDLSLVLGRAKDTLLLSVALALGIVVTTASTRFLGKYVMDSVLSD